MSRENPSEVKAEAKASNPGGVTRRTLLVQGGVAAVGLTALGRAGSLLAQPSVETRPRIGALYYADHSRRRDHWQRMQEVPLLGYYDSSEAGIIDAHLAMARIAGLSFFLVPSRGTSAAQKSLDVLLARCAGKPFHVAVLIEPDEDSRVLARARRTGLLHQSEYVQLAADWLLARHDDLESRGWYGHPAYLLDSEGRRISGFFRWDEADATTAVVEEVHRRRPDLARNHHFWFAGTHEVQEHPRPVVKATLSDRISWFALQPELGDGWDRSVALYRKLSSHGTQRVVAVSPSFDSVDHPGLAPRDEGRRLAQRLEAIARLDPAPTHVVVTSFNDWRNLTAVEPGTIHGKSYLRVLGEWSAAQA